MEQQEEQNDQIQLPPGWGPVVFLAAVILLSNAGLGLWMSSMITTTPPRPAAAAAGGAQQAVPAQASNQGAKGQKAPGAQGAVPGAQGAAGAQAGAAASTWEVDEAEFTPELDAKLSAVAQSNGFDPEDLPSARQLFEQMQRSNLLPRNQDLDLETVLTGHVMEMSRQSGNADPGAKAFEAGTPGGGPPGGGPPVPGAAPPVSEGQAPK